MYDHSNYGWPPQMQVLLDFGSWFEIVSAQLCDRQGNGQDHAEISQRLTGTSLASAS